MSAVARLAMNFPISAPRVLGMAQFARYVTNTVLAAPRVAKERSLAPVDKKMAGVLPITFMGRTFNVDTAVEDFTNERGHVFAEVREMFLRNVYFRHLDIDPAKIESVVDIGANSGVFSAFATSFAKRIVCIEAMPEYVPAISRMMAVNGFDNYTIETVFIGERGDFQSLAAPRAGLADILDSRGIGRVDLLKIDIEGSEFALFAKPDWLERVDNLTMEVHPGHGDPETILDALRYYGFVTVAADRNLRPTQSMSRVEFIAARR
ncbi:MAG: FkbM family methyltransferase [Gemmatimonadaceae bacterium]|nr:FkbM family methyltransferase [Gemmatimonadaceae bacterium]